MNFYKLDDIASRSGDQVFKTSPTGKCISLVVFTALALGSLYLAVRGGIHQGKTQLPAALFYVLAVILGLAAWYCFSVFRAALKSTTNWLLRCNTSGIVIHYRSYLNWRLPSDDIQVVSLDYAEIAWARTVKERRVTPSIDQHNGGQIQFLTYLDIGLANPDTSALEANLQRERSISPDGVVTTLDYPVSVSPGGIIEIRWNGGISPSVAKAIQYLSQHVKIADLEKRKTDLTYHRNLSPDEQRAKILALAQSGDKMGATKLAQEFYGYTLTQAHDFVDKLTGDDS